MNQNISKNKTNTNTAVELKKVGIVSDAHGIRGEVYVILFSGDNSWINHIKSITLKSANSHGDNNDKILKIKKIKAFKKGFICSFSEVTNRNEAEELKKMEVWTSAQLFVSEDGEQPFLSELLHFKVSDTVAGDLGEVIGFSSNGLQDLLVLSHVVNSQNVEIPFIKEFMTEVDYVAQKITTTLPEGLIEINEKD